jgi:hypothetical protein
VPEELTTTPTENMAIHVVASSPQVTAGRRVSKEGRKLIGGTSELRIVRSLAFRIFNHLPRSFAPLNFGISSACAGKGRGILVRMTSQGPNRTENLRENGMTF